MFFNSRQMEPVAKIEIAQCCYSLLVTNSLVHVIKTCLQFDCVACIIFQIGYCREKYIRMGMGIRMGVFKLINSKSLI